MYPLACYNLLIPFALLSLSFSSHVARLGIALTFTLLFSTFINMPICFISSFLKFLYGVLLVGAR